MKKILVTGGTGELGRELVPRLVANGYSVRVMSRRSAPGQLAEGVAWFQADLASGKGLATAVSNVDVIIHAATKPQPFHRASRAVDVVGTQKLLEHAEKAGVHHFLYISIVGIDKIPFFYYKHKLAAEKIVQASTQHWSILRAVQFHSFIDRLTSLWAKLPIMFVPKAFCFQPMDTGEVAEVIVAGIQKEQRGRWPDLFGPEVRKWGDMAESWLAASGEERRIFNLPVWGAVGAGFRAGFNTSAERPFGTVTWEDWLARNRAEQ